MRKAFFRKILRELDNFQQQILGIYEAVVWKIKKIIGIKQKSAYEKVRTGSKPLSKKILIYLAFQPKGIVESTFEALDVFSKAEYSIFFVSNSVLQATEITRLLPKVSILAERDNVGYDFGGYLYAVNYLKTSEISADSLTIVNDSAWFPINNAKPLLDLADQILHFGGATSMLAGKKSQYHVVLSYWLIFGSQILKHKVFTDFWSQYIPTNSKYRTVRLGERGLSKYFIDRKIPVECQYDEEVLMKTLGSASFEQVQLTLKFAAFIDDDFSVGCQSLLDDYQACAAWKNDAINFVQLVIYKRNFHASFCYASIVLMGTPFIKKNSAELHTNMRRQYLRGLAEGHFPMPSSAVLAEIKSRTPL